MLTTNQLNSAKTELQLRAGGGISLPAAGAIYWGVLGVAGFYISTGQWIMTAFIGSGVLFPLGLLLSKPLGADLLIRDDPLNSLAIRAVIAINLLWPVHIAAFFIAPQIVPLSLAIGMALHWPIIGWLYDSRACMVHAFARVAVASTLWFIFPQGRFTALPLSVAAIYLFTVVLIYREVEAAKASQ